MECTASIALVSIHCQVINYNTNTLGIYSMSSVALVSPIPVVSIDTLEDCIDYIITQCNLKHYHIAEPFMYKLFTELNPQYMLTLYSGSKAVAKQTLQHYIIQQLNQAGVYECLLKSSKR